MLQSRFSADDESRQSPGPAVRRHHEVQHEGDRIAPELFEPGSVEVGRIRESCLIGNMMRAASPIHAALTPIVVGG